MKLIVVLIGTFAAFAAGSPARPGFNPDTLMFNDGMLGGDIAGGMYELSTDVEVSIILSLLRATQTIHI